MTRSWRYILPLVVLATLSAAPAAAQPAGTVTFAVHVTLATRWLDPAATDSEITPFTIFYALPAARAAARRRGTVTFAVHVTLATRWLDPAETDSEITPFMIFYALHDALVKPMPAALNAPSLAEAWAVAQDG